MKQESENYLDTVACIARANLAHHQQKPQQLREPEEAGASLLMSTYLEMHELWQKNQPGLVAPPERIYFAATRCVELHTTTDRC